jgi:hypothetical protein
MAHRWLPATWSKRVRTALHGRLPMAISKGLRPSHRRSFRSAFYLWHTPTLVDFKHLVDFTRHRELIPGPTRASLFSRRHRLLVDVGKQHLAAASREYVPAARRVAVSSYSFGVADFPFRTYKLRVSLHKKLSRFGTVSSQSNEQALPGLSWLSYSPPGFPGRRSLSSLRYRVSPHGKSPRSQRCTVRQWRIQAPSTGFAPVCLRRPCSDLHRTRFFRVAHVSILIGVFCIG